MSIKKKISIFGSTGSIGKSSLEVIEANKDKFEVVYLSTNKNIDLIFKQAADFHVKGIIISDDSAYKEAKSRNFKLCPIYGSSDLVKISNEEDFDILIAAMVGFAGLESTIAAIRSGKDIALANKETLVVAGHLITELAEKKSVKILPIDSEHSAILQCIVGEEKNTISRLILTASGGPFINTPLSEFHQVKIEEALNHPNWSMGRKITIDSATMMNKGLEVIEAGWLFGLKKDQIEVVIHPQSIVHSMVEFCDGSIKAQMGLPDMKLPIQYALSYPERFDYSYTKMDFSENLVLTFQKPDFNKFRCLSLAYSSMASGGIYPVILNAANEVAVDLFLNSQIRFSDIPLIIEKALDKNYSIKFPDLEEIMYYDNETREFCRSTF